MFNFDFIYDFLNLFLLWIMIYEGKLVSKGKYYWKYCFWIILFFTIIEGVRYGRGVDYMHYIEVYKFDLEKDQVLFTSFNNILKSIGISPEFSFMFYAFPFICGAMAMMKPMRKYAMYMYPLFLMSIISMHEAFVRQMLAMSFIFMYIVELNDIIDELLDKKIKIKSLLPLVFFIVIAYSIHSIAAVGIFVITLVTIFLRKPLPWIYMIPILLIGKFYVSKNFDFSYLNSILNFFGASNDKFSLYTENADRWFSIDAMQDAYTRNIFIEILETFGCCALIYLGNKLFRNSLPEIEGQSIKKSDISLGVNTGLYISLYNVFIIGTVILETFYNLEIVRRVAHSWDIYWFVPMALVLYYRNNKIFNGVDKFLMLGFFFWVWEYIRFLFVWSDTPMFIWDK